MAKRATKDTFGFERVSDDVEVRRKIMAGDAVPDHYDVPKGDVEDVEVGLRTTSYSTNPGFGSVAGAAEKADELQRQSDSAAAEEKGDTEVVRPEDVGRHGEPVTRGSARTSRGARGARAKADSADE